MVLSVEDEDEDDDEMLHQLHALVKLSLNPLCISKASQNQVVTFGFVCSVHFHLYGQADAQSFS